MILSNPLSPIFVFLMGLTMMSEASAQALEKDVVHLKVYHEPGRYAGWPANTGIWAWGNEILTGFSKGYYKDNGVKHGIDRQKEEIHVLARSADGGESWEVTDPGKDGVYIPMAEFGTQRTDVAMPAYKKLKRPLNFTRKGFVLLARMGSDKQSSLWASENKGHDWTGPFALPDFGKQGTAARTDYIVYGKRDCMLFLTSMKSDGQEGRVMCVRTTDGGMSWSFVSWIGEEPAGYSIMPASARVSQNEILVTARNKEEDESFIASYHSGDQGRTWSYLGRVVDDTGIGNPPALVRMSNGHLCLVYGYRSDPGGKKTSDIRARISADNGRTWSRDYLLRNDGSGRDIGYPRVVQRSDGKIVIVYYFMDEATGPERYIAVTIWTPPLGN